MCLMCLPKLPYIAFDVTYHSALLDKFDVTILLLNFIKKESDVMFGSCLSTVINETTPYVIL